MSDKIIPDDSVHSSGSSEADAEPDFVEAALVEAEFIEDEFMELDYANFEVPYQYTDEYLQSVADRVEVFIESFEELGWKCLPRDVQELRGHFYNLPQLECSHLFDLLQRDHLVTRSGKIKPPKKGKFDKFYFARMIKDLRSFLKYLPKLLKETCGAGQIEGNRWVWKNDTRDYSIPINEVYGLLMERLEARRWHNIPAEHTQSDSSPNP